MKRKRKRRGAKASATRPIKKSSRKRGRRRKNPRASAIGGFIVAAIAGGIGAMLMRPLVGARWAGVAAQGTIFGLVSWKGKDWLGLEDGTRSGAMWSSGLFLGASLLFGGIAAEWEKSLEEHQGQSSPVLPPPISPEVRQLMMATGQASGINASASQADNASGAG